MAFSRKRYAWSVVPPDSWWQLTPEKRLSGASLLVFANKTDVKGCMTGEEMQKVGR